MVEKSKTKKKNNRGLLIFEIVGVVICVTGIIGTVIFLQSINQQSSSQISTSNNSSSEEYNYPKPLDIDDDFVNQLKKHKYQEFSSDNIFPLENNGKYFDLKIPHDFAETADPSNVTPHTFINRNSVNKASYNFWTIPTTGTVDDALKTYLDSELESDKIIYQFNKNVNGKEFKVTITKFPSPTLSYRYRIIYSRMLNEGTSEQSALMGSCKIDDNIGNKYPIHALDLIYLLEDTFGGFDESKQ